MINILIDIKLSCHQGRNVQSCVNSESFFRHWVCPKLAPVFHVKNHFCQERKYNNLILYLRIELLQMPRMTIPAFVAAFSIFGCLKNCVVEVSLYLGSQFLYFLVD